MAYMLSRAPYRRTRDQGLPGPRRPQSARDLQVAHPRRAGREGPHGEIRPLAARRVAAPRDPQGRGTRHRAAGREVRVLPRRPERHAAAHRLDRALSRLLDRQHLPPRTSPRPDGQMSVSDITAAAQTDAIAFEFDLAHPPEKVWRALTDPELLKDWLLPVIGLDLTPGAAFTYKTQPYPGW